MRRGHTALIMVLMALLCIMIVAPGAVGAADPPAPPPNPADFLIGRLGAPVVPAAPAMTAMDARNAQSVHFASQGRVSVSAMPPDLTFTLNGDINKSGDLRGTLTFGGAITTEDVSPLDFLLVNRAFFVLVPASLGIGDKDTWVLIDKDALTALTSGFPGLSSTTTTTRTPTATNQLPMVKTETLADETVNGTLSTHQRVTLDLATLVGATGAKPAIFTFDVWAGKVDMQPRRLTVNGTLTLDVDTFSLATATTSASNATPLTVAFTADFTYAATPVTITRPTAFVTLSDLLK